jgi:hypothetical protein
MMNDVDDMPVGTFIMREQQDFWIERWLVIERRHDSIVAYVESTWNSGTNEAVFRNISNNDVNDLLFGFRKATSTFIVRPEDVARDER